MNFLEIDSKVCISGTQLTGTVQEIAENGMVSVLLEDGSTSILPPALVVPAPDTKCPSTPAPDTKCPAVVLPDNNRTNDGSFAKGHVGYGRNDEFKVMREDARDVRQHMLEELAPFLRNIGHYIGQIKTAEKKVDAIAKMAPYCMPSLSKVEFTDETPRNLTVEEQLADFLARRKKG